MSSPGTAGRPPCATGPARPRVTSSSKAVQGTRTPGRWSNWHMSSKKGSASRWGAVTGALSQERRVAREYLFREDEGGLARKRARASGIVALPHSSSILRQPGLVIRWRTSQGHRSGSCCAWNKVPGCGNDVVGCPPAPTDETTPLSISSPVAIIPTVCGSVEASRCPHWLELPRRGHPPNAPVAGIDRITILGSEWCLAGHPIRLFFDDLRSMRLSHDGTHRCGRVLATT